MKIVQEISAKYPDILGVLIVGSFVQQLLLPFTPSYESLSIKRQAMHLIHKYQRRRICPRPSSDFDIWICLKNLPEHNHLENDIDANGIELIRQLSKQLDIHGTKKWVKMKKRAFNKYYKNGLHYSKEWVKANGCQPWLATQWKKELEDRFVVELPENALRINQYFDNKVPGTFFEVRAFPEFAFHLKPEATSLAEGEDRTPFPRIVNEDWLDVDVNTIVLYKSDTVNERTAYPFGNRRQGLQIKEFIDR